MIANIARWIVPLVYLRLLLGAAITFRRSGASWGSIPLALTFWLMIAASQRTELFLPLAIPATVFLVGGLVLFQWASNSIRGRFFSYIGNSDTPQFVFDGGPFAYIRHPFYASYLITNTAVAMAFPSWASVATAIGTLALLWGATVFEERKFEKSPSAAEYRAYIARTGRFLPKL